MKRNANAFASSLMKQLNMVADTIRLPLSSSVYFHWLVFACSAFLNISNIIIIPFFAVGSVNNLQNEKNHTYKVMNATKSMDGIMYHHSGISRWVWNMICSGAFLSFISRSCSLSMRQNIVHILINWNKFSKKNSF